MKKRVFGKKLGRSTTARRALFRALVRAMVLYGSIKTTKAKAKAVQIQINKLIKIGKAGDVPSKRRIYAYLANDRSISQKIYSISTEFLQTSGGYTRIVPLPRRLGDSAEMVRLEWSRKIEIDKQSKEGKIKGGEKQGRVKAKLVEAETEKAKPSLRSRIAKFGKIKSKK